MKSNGIRLLQFLACCFFAANVPHSQAQDESEVAVAKPAEGADDLESLLKLDISELGNIDVDPFSSKVGTNIEGGSDRQMSAESLESNYVGGHEADTRNTTDAGNLLGKSNMNPGVYIQQRSPIISDPRIRGYRSGQFLTSADGASWVPARLDLDSITSKLDSKVIKDIVVINGPYSARYGPGFAFIDIATLSTPRYEDGPNWNGSTSLTYNGNGQQWNGSQSFQFGSEDWGASVFYSNLTGSDYLDGAGNRVPSSYHSQNVITSIGFDLADDTRIEFRYLRQDQTDVELAGQFSDIDWLKTDGFVMNFTSEDQSWVDQLRFNTWYNRTAAHGITSNPSKQALYASLFPNTVAFPNNLPRGGQTAFDVMSLGYSLAATWGVEDETQFTAGSDLRYYRQSLTEIQTRPNGSGAFQSGTEDVFALLPESEMVDPGVFTELAVPVSDYFRVKTGGRVDWISNSAGPGVILRRVNNGGVGSPRDVIGTDRENSYLLWSAFITGEYEVTEELIAAVGFGMAQRPPTLTELYAMRPFESVLQQGMNRIQGYPLLSPERLKQLDIGLRYDDEEVRGGIRGFHAWINDYITSQGFAVDPSSPGDARITSVFVNTPLATLAGGEAYGEYDWSDSWTVFGNVMYVEGRNQTLNRYLFNTPSAPAPVGSSQGLAIGRNNFFQGQGQEPLPQISPLESRVGLRWHEAQKNPRWGTEFMARIVDAQDRVAGASLLERATPGFTTFDFRGYWKPYEQLTFVYGVLNITDRHYREHLDNRAGNQLFQPGITGYIGTELTY